MRPMAGPAVARWKRNGGKKRTDITDNNDVEYYKVTKDAMEATSTERRNVAMPIDTSMGRKKYEYEYTYE